MILPMCGEQWQRYAQLERDHVRVRWPALREIELDRPVGPFLRARKFHIGVRRVFHGVVSQQLAMAADVLEHGVGVGPEVEPGGRIAEFARGGIRQPAGKIGARRFDVALCLGDAILKHRLG